MSNKTESERAHLSNEKTIASWTRYLAVGTGILAIATIVLAYFTYEMAKDGRESSKHQIGIQTWLELEKRFDSSEMHRKRHNLAILIREGKEVENEDVLDFFEDVGMLYHLGYIDKDMAKSSFGYYASRWWIKLQRHVTRERNLHHDPSLFDEFEHLVKEIGDDPKTLTPVEVELFSREEQDLTHD